MKKKVSLLHLIQNLCQLIRNQSQQSKFKLPAQSKTLYIRTQLMRAGENLKQLMDTHNLNLPPDWTFPQFTTEVIGIIFFFDFTGSFFTLYGSDSFHQASNLLHFLSSGAGGG